MIANSDASFAATVRDAASGRWFEYRDHVLTLSAAKVCEVEAALAEIERRVEAEGVFAVGFVSYEAASAFDPCLTTYAPTTLPLLSFGLFRERIACDVAAAARSCVAWSALPDPAAYARRIDTIREHIAVGDVYQVNYTERLHAQDVDAVRLFHAVAAHAPYGAYLEDAAAGWAIVSASPELFFSRCGETLISKPMKGTAPRGLSADEDTAQAAWLARSAKNRAENLMITDMVRNDMGRIAKIGSVRVAELFGIEQYPTVWQMTSTVQAQTSASLLDIFRALFPAASITGAPKRAAMNLISRLESAPRGVYTGAIGMLAPGRTAQFSVGIRTAQVDLRGQRAIYGVGGGIVWESNAQEEYREMAVKSRVLHMPSPRFMLLETMRWQHGGIFLLQRHLHRLAASARYFSIPIHTASICRQVLAAARDSGMACARVRLTVDRAGSARVECSEIPESAEAQRIALAPEPVDQTQPWLYHKTTHREVYARAAAAVPKGCEALLHNQAGYVTETAIANVVYRLDGQLFTPPVCDGVLPGTLRAELLAAGEVSERSLHITQAGAVDAWFLVNALRGWRSATLVGASNVPPRRLFDDRQPEPQ